MEQWYVSRGVPFRNSIFCDDKFFGSGKGVGEEGGRGKERSVRVV